MAQVTESSLDDPATVGVGSRGDLAALDLGPYARCRHGGGGECAPGGRRSVRRD
ncbi:hypothetical protein ABZ297_21095 [Nonomuraea sp. NPDC005983]|uniref:hypothetical protein n=1 Tax=Nonomuraea sp. NPDC005983 TaxID=3155595 RepID=UPI0033A5C44C